MSQPSRALPALQSIRSLPHEFKITGNQTPDFMEKHGEVILRSTDVIGSSSPENGALVGEVFEKGVQDCAGDTCLFDEDLAYSRKPISLEERPSIADEDLESVPRSFPSISMSSRERRWGDTTPYASKKVHLASDFNLISL